ncbi:MAG TPA: hypothetical protein VLK36_00920 [Gaiellaceae bacterium]|nr:hypothetical protein [Gaiellaceae bacterium]
MTTTRVRAAVLAGMLALALAAGASVAHADADPASDYLLQSDVFYPFETKISGSQKAQLEAAVASARRSGLRTKVAIIAQKDDLGAVSVLYRKPQQYAKFLGTEMFYVNSARVLVVMPNGFGLWRKGGPVPPKELAAVRSLPPPGTDGDKLAAGANTAVRRILALHGVTASEAASGGNSTTRDRIVIAGGALALVVVGLAVYALLQLRRRRAGEA